MLALSCLAEIALLLFHQGPSTLLAHPHRRSMIIIHSLLNTLPPSGVSSDEQLLCAGLAGHLTALAGILMRDCSKPRFGHKPYRGRGWETCRSAHCMLCPNRKLTWARGLLANCSTAHTLFKTPVTAFDQGRQLQHFHPLAPLYFRHGRDVRYRLARAGHIISCWLHKHAINPVRPTHKSASSRDQNPIFASLICTIVNCPCQHGSRGPAKSLALTCSRARLLWRSQFNFGMPPRSPPPT